MMLGMYYSDDIPFVVRRLGGWRPFAFFVNVSPEKEAFIPSLCQALQDDYVDCWGAEPSSPSPTNYIILDPKSDSFAADIKQMAQHFSDSESRRKDLERQNEANKRKE